MSDSDEFTVEVILVLLADVRLEVVAWNHKVNFKQDTYEVINGRAPGNQL